MFEFSKRRKTYPFVFTVCFMAITYAAFTYSHTSAVALSIPLTLALFARVSEGEKRAYDEGYHHGHEFMKAFPNYYSDS